MQFLQEFIPINQSRVLQIFEKGHQIAIIALHGRALRHETVSRHARLRVRADIQVPPGNRIARMRIGTRIADGLEVVSREPDHDFRFVGVAAGVVGDESVVGDVGADGGGIIAVDSRQSPGRYQIFLSI